MCCSGGRTDDIKKTIVWFISRYPISYISESMFFKKFTGMISKTSIKFLEFALVSGVNSKFIAFIIFGDGSRYRKNDANEASGSKIL